jgi:hypothetical protein
MKKIVLLMGIMAVLAAGIFGQTVSTVDGASRGDIEDLWYKTYHYDATKSGGSIWGVQADSGQDSRHRYVTITVEKFPRRVRESKITRTIGENSTTLVYQTRKGVITEVYSNESGEYELIPTSNLNSYRDYRRVVLRTIRD